MADQQQQEESPPVKVNAEEKEEEPPSKKLRSSDPDLKVILQYGNGSTPKTYEMYAQVFARQSKFVDTLLSVEMKEKQTREIVLHDVAPHVFELALIFLESPSAVLSITAEDALKVVEFYDKYEFKEGLELVDEVLRKYVDEAKSKKGPPSNLDFLVDVMVASDKFQLKETKACGFSYLFSRFLAIQEGHYGAEMFSLEHIRKLQPFLINEKVPMPIQATKEEMESPLFPKYFVEAVSHRYTRGILKAIVVCGSNSTANGKYIRKDNTRRFEGEARPMSWDGIVVRCFLDRGDPVIDGFGDWIIGGKYPDGHQRCLFRCPNSQSLECPPMEPWMPTVWLKAQFERASLALQQPTIKYIKYDNKS